MLNDLERLWPLLQKYPWQFLTIAGMAFALGWGAHGVWRKLQPNAAPIRASHDKTHTVLRAIRRAFFRPSTIQVDCLKALRLVDHKRLEIGEVHGLLAHPEMNTTVRPRSDIEQALESLVTVGWVRRSLATGPRVVYSLEGAGLDYARREGYLVIVTKGD